MALTRISANTNTKYATVENLDRILITKPMNASLLRFVRKGMDQANAADRKKIATRFATEVAKQNALEIFKSDVLPLIDAPYKAMVSERLTSGTKSHTKEIARLFLLSHSPINLSFRKAVGLCLAGYEDKKGWDDKTEIEKIADEINGLDVENTEEEKIKSLLNKFKNEKHIYTSREISIAEKLEEIRKTGKFTMECFAVLSKCVEIN